MKAADAELIKLTINQVIIKVKIKTDNTVPDGIAGLFTGISGIPYLNLPEWGKPEKYD